MQERSVASDLAAVLARAKPIAEESAVFGKGPGTSLRITGYLSAEPPPLVYVTSARALIFHGDALLALPAAAGIYILPGGRREGDEAPATALRREVLEESGWTLQDVSPLGFMRFQNLGARLDDRYPYPDFVNLVYFAEAGHYVPGGLTPNEYEQEPFTMRPIPEVRAQGLTPIAQAFLEASLARRRDR